MIIIGCDPGKSGGVAAINRLGVITHAMVMPEPHVFADWLEEVLKDEAPNSVHVYLEKAQAMPGQGVCSMFSYGKHCGILEGLLIALQIPYTLVPPMTWCKVLHAGAKAGKPKERSLEVIRRLFPSQDLKPEGTRSKKAHSGIIDAILIAEYGRRLMVKAGP